MTGDAQITKDDAKRRIHNLVEDYLRVLSDKKQNSYNKERVKIAFVEPLFEALGWNDQASDIGIIEYRSDLIFTCKKNKIFVRILGLDESLEGCSRHGRRYVEQAFQLAFDIRADWLILTNFVETRLYPCQERKAGSVALKESQPLWTIRFGEYESRFEDLWFVSKETIVSNVFHTRSKKKETRYLPISRDRHEWIDVSGPLHGDGHVFKYFRCTRCGTILKKQYETHPRKRSLKAKVERTNAKYTPLRKERRCSCGKLFYYLEAWETHKKECHGVNENHLRALPTPEDKANDA